MEGRPTRHHLEQQLGDLIAARVIRPGDSLYGSHNGRSYKVTVTHDGRLRAHNTVYGSPSEAAREVSNQRSVNGWLFWRTATGRPIGELRTH